ncbi:MAG: hypothetical protein QGG36_10425 [Pirellulaceae bacterium]|jgi:hypothetical protein|nr:hypothetical protein [Pirellulaceae bacterium]MDP7016206.1 hypothetical protein [Pirellulaceae bacterium]
MRKLLRAALTCAAWSALLAIAAAADRLEFTVTEAAGIRRFSFPVTATLNFPKAVEKDAQFELRRAGDRVTAQFTRVDKSTVEVDFNTSLGPFESARFALSYGEKIAPPPPPRRGHRVSQMDDLFVIANEPYIVWRVPRSLERLLRSVEFRPVEHVRPSPTESLGLWLESTNGERIAVKLDVRKSSAEIIKPGPLAAQLRFTWAISDPQLPGVKCQLEMSFPVSKSWVEIAWKIEDPRGVVRRAGSLLETNLDSPTNAQPTLVDWGAGGSAYLALRPGMATRLANSPTKKWTVLRGKPGSLSPFVEQANNQMAEGWLHVMDRKRCLALAVDQFGIAGGDALDVTASGRVDVRRTFVPATSRTKNLRFWMHFVFFPPQISAATSPQAMQNPLLVEPVR